jgi:hypothetical protein
MGPTGLPVVVTPVTIHGKGATIAGNYTNFRIIAISGPAGGTLTLNGITVTGGHITGAMAGGAGGGILNLAGTLGGGIANTTFSAALTATLVINNGQVTGNSADRGAGGILNVSFDPAGTSSVTLHHTNVSSNTPDNCEPPGSVSGCTG